MKKIIIYILIFINILAGNWMDNNTSRTEAKPFVFDKINVCFIADDKYVEHTLVVIYSICKNNKSNSNYNFYILTDGLTEKNENKIKKYVTYKSQHVKIITIDKNKYKEAGSYGCGFLAPIMLSNLWIDTILPETEERCLYLDSDTLVVTDLSELYSTDLGRKTVGMVIDPLSITPPYVKGKKYYNAGTILINLKKWHAHKIGKTARNLLNNRKYMSTTFYKNQDIFNDLLKGKIKTLDYRYNYFVDHRYKDIENPYIIHYLGLKPWKSVSDWLTPESLEIVQKSPKYELYNQYEKEFNTELKKLGF